MLGGTALLVVQGDTSSALGATYAGSVARVPVAHVEAGLRSHDRNRPWPEEDFRIEIDRVAQLLFAPTDLSAANLRRERVRGSIYVTGNSGIDAVLGVRPAQTPKYKPPRERPRVLVTCHRRESWGAGITGIAGALRTVAEQKIASIDLLLHPNPATAAHMRALLLGCDGIAIQQPLGHRQAVAAMLDADCVLSDSGGIQEECAALGIPLLVLRERTERPEGIACGTMELVGIEPNLIVQALRRACRQRLGGSRPAAGSPYGDGRASDRIATIIADRLAPGPPTVVECDQPPLKTFQGPVMASVRPGP